MSELAKSDLSSDTQETYYEGNQLDAQYVQNSENNSRNMNESQDFHLIDTSDTQEFEVDLPEAPSNDGVNNTGNEKENDLTENAVDDNENKQEIFGNENQTIGEQEDDDDIVHGTPPHCLSSPSKHLSSIAEIKSLKRKADLFEDSVSKFPRDSAENNTPTIKRNKLDMQDALYKDLETIKGEKAKLEDENEESQNQNYSPEESLIIPETQDSLEDTQPIDQEVLKDPAETGIVVEAKSNDDNTEAVSDSKTKNNLYLENDNSLEEECDLVNAAMGLTNECSENQTNSTTVNFPGNDILEQNEVPSDKRELNESKDDSHEIDFSEDVSFSGKGFNPDPKQSENLTKNQDSEDETLEEQSKVTKNLVDAMENEIEGVEKELIRETKTTATNLEVSNPVIKEDEKTKIIEDTLKELEEGMDIIEATKEPSSQEELVDSRIKDAKSELLAALTDSDTNADAEDDSENKESPDNMDTEDFPDQARTREKSDTIDKSRMSIEVIYDRSSLSQDIKAKRKEVVEIDDDGEKIVLDSSQEDNVRSEIPSVNAKDETVYKSCYDSKSSSDFSYKSVGSNKDSSEDQHSDSHLANGGKDSNKIILDSTASVKSDESLDSDIKGNTPKASSINSKPEAKLTNQPVYSVSDSEGDSMVDDKSKSSAESTAVTSTVKTLQVEKEININVRLKCLVTIDENTKEIVGKELLGVNCEYIGDQNRNSDSSLADISGNDNKDNSPGSVTSATYPRFSIMSSSTVSSTTSSSSAGSLASKTSGRDSIFSVPVGRAKHPKKQPYGDEKNCLELDQLCKEWKNAYLASTTVLNFVNAELSGIDFHNAVSDSLDEPLRKIHSSTPEVDRQTPQRNSKKGRPPKRLQTKATRKRTKIVSTKVSPNVIDAIQEDSDDQSSSMVKETKNKLMVSTGSSTPVKKKSEGSRNTVPPVEQGEELLGKEVFAKWSDNNYYAGTIVDKVKAKYKVNFHDGKSKQLIPEFVVPIPKILNKGLSVYTLTKDGDYGPCGIIVDVLETINKVSYVIEPDEGKRITVQIKDIFLTSDQAQVLKEENATESSSLPSTPHSKSQVSLENMIDGKRRSRRNTSTTQTPKSKKSLTSIINKTMDTEPSVSGVFQKLKERAVSDGKTSDSNCSVMEECGVFGVQKEIVGTTSEQVTIKGPQSRMKGKQRNKKKADDPETIDLLGPIPEPNSKIFEGMSFILTCASIEGIDRYHSDNGDTNSEPGTENEEEWQARPFVRDRLEQQIIAGGGKVYDNFDLIPPSEYENTKLITNLPNLTAKSLLCLSVGISAYNHMWVIRSCQNNKAVNISEEKLPAGWSIDRRSYIEMFHRRDQKPLTHIIVVIPSNKNSDKNFVTFWSRVCENAGGIVIVADNPEFSFIEGTVVLTNRNCPAWATEKANSWQIPLVSTTWLVQSLIEGKILPYDAHKRFKPF